MCVQGEEASQKNMAAAMEQEEARVQIREEDLDRSAAEQNIACFALSTAMLEPCNASAHQTTPKRKSWTSDCTLLKTTHSEADMESGSRKILQAKRSSKEERDHLHTMDLTSLGREENSSSQCAPDSNQTLCKIPTSPAPSTMLSKDVSAEGQAAAQSTPDELTEASAEGDGLQRVGAHIPTLDLGELSEKLTKLQIETSRAKKRRAHKQQQKHIRQRLDGILENLSTKELSALFTKQDNDGDNLLMIAIIESCSVLAEALIRLVPSPELLNLRNKLGQTALHLTVITHQWRMVRRLVLAGADLEARDFVGNTALHVACSNSDLDCVISLTKLVTCLEVPEKSARERLAVPQDSELYNYKGQTCLHMAAGSGFTLLAQYLLETRFHAEVNALERLCGKTALHLAAERGSVELVTYLLAAPDTEPDALTYAGHSAVDLAAGWGHTRVLKLLERAGVKPHHTHHLPAHDHSDTDNSDPTEPESQQNHNSHDHSQQNHDKHTEPHHNHNDHMEPHRNHMEPHHNHMKPHHNHREPHHNHMEPHHNHREPHHNHMEPHHNHMEPHHNHMEPHHNHSEIPLPDEERDVLTLQDFECSVQASHRSDEALEYDDMCIGGQPILSMQNSMYM